MKRSRDSQVLDSLLGEGVHGWSVWCKGDPFWSLCTKNTEHAHQPVVGTVPSLPKVPIQHGSSVYLQSGCGNTTD